jgi:hypothetical protein
VKGVSPFVVGMLLGILVKRSFSTLKGCCEIFADHRPHKEKRLGRD